MIIIQNYFDDDDENITIELKSNISNNFKEIYHKLIKVYLKYNNKKEIFYISSIEKIFKYASYYYNIPKENMEIYLNGKKRLMLNDDPSNIAIDFLQIENITFFQKIKIFISYEKNRWELEIGRFSSDIDLLYYLEEKYNFKLDKINNRAIFIFKGKERIYTLKNSNIKNGDEFKLDIVPSFYRLKKEIKNLACKFLSKH